MDEWIWSISYAMFGAVAISTLPRLQNLMGSRNIRQRTIRTLFPEVILRATFALVVDLAYCHFHGPPDVFISMVVGAGAVGFTTAMTKH